MSRRFQFSLGTFFWPTFVVVAYVAIAVLGGLMSGTSKPAPGVEVSPAPYELKRDFGDLLPHQLGGAVLRHLAVGSACSVVPQIGFMDTGRGPIPHDPNGTRIRNFSPVGVPEK